MPSDHHRATLSAPEIGSKPLQAGKGKRDVTGVQPTGKNTARSTCSPMMRTEKGPLLSSLYREYKREKRAFSGRRHRRRREKRNTFLSLLLFSSSGSFYSIFFVVYPSSPPPPLSNEKASAAKGEAMKRPPKRQAERRDGGKRHFGVGASSLCGLKEEVTFVAS